MALLSRHGHPFVAQARGDILTSISMIDSIKAMLNYLHYGS